MNSRRTNSVANLSKFRRLAEIQRVRLFRMLSVVAVIAALAYRSTAGGISPGDIDTYTYAWTLPNQTGETAHGMQWLLGSYSISNIESVFKNSNTYPNSDLAYSDPLFDNRVIWSGSSTPQGGQALFGIETTSELGNFTGNWLDETEKNPLAPTFEFSPPSWDYVADHQQYVVRMQSPSKDRYWIQRRLTVLESPLSLDSAGDFDKLFDQAQIIDTSPRPLPTNLEDSLALGLPTEGAVGYLLAYDLYAEEGVGPGRSLGRYFNAVVLEDDTTRPKPPGDFDEDGDVDARDFLVWQRGKTPDPSDLADWQANYGGSKITAATSAVPEPATLWLAAAALIFAAGNRR